MKLMLLLYCEINAIVGVSVFGEVSVSVCFCVYSQYTVVYIMGSQHLQSLRLLLRLLLLISEH